MTPHGSLRSGCSAQSATPRKCSTHGTCKVILRFLSDEYQTSRMRGYVKLWRKTELCFVMLSTHNECVNVVLQCR